VEFSWAARDGEPTLFDVGEEAALRGALPRMPRSERRILGPGDDAAVIAAPDGRYVVTSDSMIEGPDFRQAWTTPEAFGWKLVATNLADLAAMGARPTAMTVSIALPGDVRASALEEIATGMRTACDELAPGCGVEGGDLARSPIIVGSGTAFGDLEGRAPVLRSGARHGDVVAVSGHVGRAALGLDRLFRDAVREGEPDVFAFERLRAEASDAELAALDAQLRPRPPVADGVLAAQAGATAMLDLSDGLALDARRIALSSAVAIDLDGDAVLAVADESPGWGLDRVLAGGEDHALLATFPPGAALPGGFVPIGRVVVGQGLFVNGEGYDDLGGWDPFRAG